MQLPSNYYYPKEALPNGAVEQMYSLRANTDDLIAKLLFSHDDSKLSRVLWSHPDYNFARRAEMLASDNKSSAHDNLQLPFVSYYRDGAEGNWQYDDRPAGRQVSSQIDKVRWGQDNTGVEGQAIQAMMLFHGMAFFAHERDALIALESLFWWSNRPVWGEYYVYASDTRIHIPATYFLETTLLVPEQNMTSWMQQQKLSQVSFRFKVYTPLIRVPASSPPIVMTESVVHYFHNRQFDVPEEALPTTAEGWQAIADEVFEIEETTGGGTAANTSRGLKDIVLAVNGSDAVFTWEYVGDTPSTITFYLHRGDHIETQIIDIDDTNPATTATLTDLFSQSLYDVIMKVSYSDSKVLKYHYQIQTDVFPEQRKGLHGLKGMTL